MPTDQELIRIVPSERQLAYQETEFYAFFHFGMNTYTDREWGDGTEDPKFFNPARAGCRPVGICSQKRRHEGRDPYLQASRRLLPLAHRIYHAQRCLKPMEKGNR